MSDLIKCVKCGVECSSENGLKRHWSLKHGTYSDKDLTDSGITTIKRGSDVARTLAGGFRSGDDVAKAAPATDNESVESTSERTETRGRKRKGELSDEEKAKKEKAALARKRIGEILCKKAARGPYVAAAGMLNDARWLLSPDEEKELTEATMQLMDSYDMDMSKPIWAIIALLAIHSDCVAIRLPLILGAGQPPTEENPEQPAKVN